MKQFLKKKKERVTGWISFEQKILEKKEFESRGFKTAYMFLIRNLSVHESTPRY